jgi:Protein of unknown function (DUF3179)
MRPVLLAAPAALLLAALCVAADPVLVAKPDAYPTLVNPACSHCKDEAKRRADDLTEFDRVLAWTRGKYDGGAIPLRFFLNPYRVISDTYGVFVYDPDAGYARGFEPSLDFTFYGWRNGVMAMKHKDGTLFSCLSGVAFDGPRKGTRLKPVPTVVTDWGPWLKQYPDTVAYQMPAKFQPTSLPYQPNPVSVKTRGAADTRLAPDAPVLGVFDGSAALAWRLNTKPKDGAEAQTVDGKLLVWNGATASASAYKPVASAPGGTGGRNLTVRKVTWDPRAEAPIAAFKDDETGSKWDVAGRCVEGQLKGWTLEPLDAVQVKWFAWAAEYPGTKIVE